MHHHHDLDALEVGTAYALYAHGLDEQTQQLTEAITRTVPSPTVPAPTAPSTIETHVHIHTEETDRRGIRPVNALNYARAMVPDSWEDYVGQEPMKRQMRTYIADAATRGTPLPHTLLASGQPGIGKTTMATLLAKMLGKKIVKMVPPFNVFTLAEAAATLGVGDILFIDEIHKLVDHRKSGAEVLLTLLEDGVIYLPDGEVVKLRPITVIGATTDKGLLPETVIDRFEVKPYFQPYTLSELVRIVAKFAGRCDALESVDPELVVAIARACRGTPRICKEMILGARALRNENRRIATPRELLAFLEVEPDGLTRTHIHYITAMRQYFPRVAPALEGGGVEYVVGEAAITQILRETKQGIARIEAFLVETGLLDRTPRGRRLTARGIARAETLIRAGKGACDVG